MTTVTRTALTDIAIRAGALALGHFRQVMPERKPDHTLVTAADREIETTLVNALAPLWPRAGLIGEEGTRTPSQDGNHLVIDPLDGTAAFVSGLPTWGVCFGVLQGGVPTAGVVHLPVTQETYVALDGQATLNGRPLRALGSAPPAPGEEFALAHAKSHLRHTLRYPGKVRSLGSTAYHLALVANGVAEAALVGRVKVWDLVGPLAILHAVGGALWNFDRTPVDLDRLLDGSANPSFSVAAAHDRLPDLLPLLGAP